MDKKEIFKHTYDFNSKRTSIIGYPIIACNNEKIKGFTIRCTPSQTQTILENEIDKLDVTIDTESNSIKTTMYSFEAHATIFEQKLINELLAEYQKTITATCSDMLTTKTPNEKEYKKSKLIKTMLSSCFNITDPHKENASILEINETKISEQNPKYIYEHTYSIISNEFSTDIHTIKQESTDTYKLQSIKTKDIKPLKIEHMNILLKSKKEKKYYMFTREPDSTTFQTQIISELTNDMSSMQIQTEILDTCKEYISIVINNIDKHIKTKTNSSEIYEFIFKNGKFGIKTHKIIRSNSDTIVIDDETIIRKNNLGAIILDTPSFSDKFTNNCIYRAYSQNNDMTVFKNNIKEKLKSYWLTKIDLVLDAVKSRLLSNENTNEIIQYPPVDINDIETYTKNSNATSDSYITLFRLRRNLYNENERHIRFTATDIPYMNHNKNTVQIFKENNGSEFILSKDLIDTLQITAVGDMYMWSDTEADLNEYSEKTRKEKFIYYLERISYETQKEKRELEQIINGI